MDTRSEDLMAGGGWLEGTALYREFLAEQEEILRHKWLESEKAGRDIGFDQALVIWVVHHRAQWRQGRRASIGMAPAG